MSVISKRYAVAPVTDVAQIPVVGLEIVTPHCEACIFVHPPIVAITAVLVLLTQLPLAT